MSLTISTQIRNAHPYWSERSRWPVLFPGRLITLTGRRAERRRKFFRDIVRRMILNALKPAEI